MLPHSAERVSLRRAAGSEVEKIIALVGQLAAACGESTALTPAYVRSYLRKSSVVVLLAEPEGQMLGLLSLSTRPNLYLAAPCYLVEELLVEEGWRGRGIGSALMLEAIRIAAGLGCAEISVSTKPDNARALSLYRAHGPTGEALLLERHF